MPEDVNDEAAETTEAEAPEIVHDDIVKRLLDYQRQLREGFEETSTGTAAAASAVATETATDELVDLTGGHTVEEDFMDLSADAAGASSRGLDEVAGDASGPSSSTSPIAETEGMSVPTDAATDARDRAEATDAEVIVLHPEAQESDADPAADAASSRDDAPMSPGEPSDEAGHAGAWPGTAASPAMPLPEASNVPTPMGADPSDEAADRILELERRLEILSARFADLRSSFQDMAIAADERLAEIEDLLGDARGGG